MSSSSKPEIDLTAFAEPTGYRRLIKLASPGIQLGRLAVFIALIVAWNLVVKYEVVKPLYSATPRETWDALIKLPPEALFWTDLWVTLRTALGGWVIGSFLGLVAGLVIGRSQILLRVLGPYLTFLNAIPKIALAPIFIGWFGIYDKSKVFSAVLTTFFIVQVPTTAAVALVDPDLDTVAITMGANNFQRFMKVYLPGIFAAVFGALRLAAVYALLTVVFTEFLAARYGLGQRLITATGNFRFADAFAVIIVLAVLALLINGAVGLVERRALRWKNATSAGSVVSG